MLVNHWLRSLSKISRRALAPGSFRTRRPKRRKLRDHIPTVERLEDRTLPAAPVAVKDGKSEWSAAGALRIPRKEET